MHGPVTRSKYSHPSMNVTPLVDIVLVLLIIFMVITPLLNRHMEIKLSKHARNSQTDEEQPEQPPMVRIRANGRHQVNDRELGAAEVRGHIETLLKDREERKVRIFVDSDTTYDEVVHVLDETRAAGASDLILEPQRQL